MSMAELLNLVQFDDGRAVELQKLHGDQFIGKFAFGLAYQCLAALPNDQRIFGVQLDKKIGSTGRRRTVPPANALIHRR